MIVIAIIVPSTVHTSDVKFPKCDSGSATLAQHSSPLSTPVRVDLLENTKVN